MIFWRYILKLELLITFSGHLLNISMDIYAPIECPTFSSRNYQLATKFQARKHRSNCIIFRKHWWDQWITQKKLIYCLISLISHITDISRTKISILWKATLKERRSNCMHGEIRVQESLHVGVVQMLRRLSWSPSEACPMSVTSKCLQTCNYFTFIVSISDNTYVWNSDPSSIHDFG